MNSKNKFELTGFISSIIVFLIITNGAFATIDNIPESDSIVLSESINEFAFNLYNKIKDSPAIKKNEGNVFFSPYSIVTALTMTYTGASGDTAKQMLNVLCLPSATIEEIADSFSSLQNNLLADSEYGGYELNIANSLWLNTGYSFLTEFIDINKKYFNSGINKIDFSKPVESAKIINAWIENQTKDKIKNMISPEVINPLYTELILTNAIYFKGSWISPFEERATQEADFHVTEDKTVKVFMMSKTEERNIKYGEIDEIQLLQMPYGPDNRSMQEIIRTSLGKLESVQEIRNQISTIPGSDSENRNIILEKMRQISDEHRQNMEAKMRRLSMIILLPKTIDGLEAVEDRLNHEMLQSYIEQMKQQEVRIFIPKFKISFNTIELKDILIEMGMKDAFSSSVADFSRIDGTKDLFLYTVLHKTYIDVDEKGTEAAAATVVGGARGEIGPRSSPPVFRADRPFIFMIRDNHTGSILFIGRVIDPTFEG